MKIGVLDLTEPMPGVLDDLPRVSQTIINWISPAMPDATFVAYDIISGAPFPAPGAVDGVIISGSEHGVYDDQPWMQPLRDFLVASKDLGVPMFGICFGHQILADVFGGKAEQAPQGLHVGMREFAIDGARVATHVWHKDQVTKQPEGSTIWASAEYCPIGALTYDFPAMSVQFHPEYSKELLYRVFDLAKGYFVTDEMVKEADRSFAKGEADRSLVASKAALFFREHVAIDQARNASFITSKTASLGTSDVTKA